MTMPAPKHCRLLQYSTSDLPDGLPLLFASNNLPVKAARFEPAGFSFHAAALRLLGFTEKVEGDDAATDTKDSSSAFSSTDSYYFKGKKKSGSGNEQQDHYALLGLSHLRFLATEEQIRKAYREVALKHHPDKQASLILLEETEEAKEAKKQDIDSHFKAIQEAYEILIDPLKRRVYDSVDEFDDGIPSDCPAEDFFKVFGPVFLRNGRWSVVQPVPAMGQDDTPMSDVDTFYDFWYGFKSWREFPHADEFDLEQAENREHKRWMERQNLKLREKAKKEESARIRTLVENAYKKDPRIMRRKEEEKAEKLKRKQAKLLAKKEKEDQVAKAMEEERIRKEEEDKRLAEEAAAQKKVKEKEKRLIRKERSRLRMAASVVVSKKSFMVKEADVESLCTRLDLAQLKMLCEKLEGRRENVNEQARILQGALAESGDGSDTNNPVTHVADSKGQSDGPEIMKKPNEEEKKERPWTKEEVDLLRKATTKYPKGTSQRWEVVSEYIGTGRSVEEILKAIKTVLLQKPDSSKAFDTFLQKRKPSNSIASPLSTRDEGDEVASKTSPAAANGTSNGETVAHASQTGNSNENVSSVNGKATGLEEGSGAANGVALEQDLWSEAQELALVKALKTFPKEAAQRWERIATAVPGKTKAQCFKKFAALRENFRSKK